MSDDQRIHDLEQRHMSLRKEHDILRNDRDNLLENSKIQQRTNVELSESLQHLSKQLVDKDVEIKRKDGLVKELEQSNEEYRERLLRRSEECDRLRDDIKSQAEQLISQQSRLKEALSALSEAQSQQLPLQYDVTKLTRENDLLQNRVTWTENELNEKSAEFLKSRRELSDKVFAMESELESLRSENKQLIEKQKHLQDTTATQSERIEHYTNQIRDLEINLSSEKNSFLQELDAQKRLVDLYKRYFEETTARVEELEKEQASSTAEHQQRVNAMQSQHQKRVNELLQLIEDQKAELEGKIQALQTRVEEGTMDSGMSLLTAGGATIPVTDGSPAVTVQDLSGISMTELYDKVVRAEQELGRERGKRREVEIYLSRVLKDVEAKTPLITAQRRDYQRVVESHERLSRKFDEVLQDNNSLRGQVEGLGREMAELRANAQSLEVHNKDLCKQLQNLLKKNLEKTYGKTLPDSADRTRASSTSTSTDVISDYLVTFDDVEQLQIRNEQLLKAIRKLEAECRETVEHRLQTTNRIADSDSTGEEAEQAKTLQTALSELAQMREARKRMEDMLMGLVQQRDMYRAMLEEADATIAAKTGAASSQSGAVLAIENGRPTPGTPFGSPQHGTVTLSSPRAAAITPGKLHELQKKVEELEEERKKLLERVYRVEETERAMSDALDRERNEMSTLRSEAAHATAEARFQTSRATSLEQALATANMTLESVVRKRAELEGLLVAQQREMKVQEERLLAASDSLRGTQEALRRAEFAVDASKHAEERLMAQLSEARDEMQKQRTLSDSLLRIENGLASRAEEEMASLVRERDVLRTTLENIRKDSSDRLVMLEQRLLAAEEDLRVSRINLQQREQELASTKELYLREQAAAKSSQDRNDLLERQLSELQHRFEQVRGLGAVESIALKDIAQIELALERANSEVESLRSQLSESQQHAEQFRRIGATTETMLKDLTERSNATKKAYEEEITALKATIESCQQEVVEKRQAYVLALQDAEKAQDVLSESSKLHLEQVKALESQRDNLLQETQQLQAQMDILKQDVSKLQQAARSAHDNYERELQLHAQAATAVKSLEEELDRARAEKATAQQALADQTVVMLRGERLHQEQNNALVHEKNELRGRLEEMQRSNDLLLSQVQALGAQVDKFHANRIDQFVNMGAAAQSSSDVTVGNVSDAVEELQELRRTSTELREVIRFLKREKDTLDAKLSVAQSEITRHQTSLATTQRILEDTRAELKAETEKRASTRDEAEFARIMAEVTQLNILRESNSHLRSENESLGRQLKDVTDALGKAKVEHAPLQERVRSLETSKAVLEAEREALAKDAAYWKDRLHQLVSRYNDVDPEEHRQLALKLEQVTKSANEFQEKYLTLSAEKTNVEESLRKELEMKGQELVALRATNGTQEENLDKMRNMLRKRNADMRESEIKMAGVVRENEQLKKQVLDLENTVSSLNKKLSDQSVILEKTKDVAAAATSAALVSQMNTGTVVAASSSSAAPASDSSHGVPVPASATAPPMAGGSGDVPIKPPVPVPVPVPVPALSALSASTPVAAAANPASGTPAVEETLRQALMAKLQKGVKALPRAAATAADGAGTTSAPVVGVVSTAAAASEQPLAPPAQAAAHPDETSSKPLDQTPIVEQEAAVNVDSATPAADTLKADSDEATIAPPVKRLKQADAASVVSLAVATTPAPETEPGAQSAVTDAAPPLQAAPSFGGTTAPPAVATLGAAVSTAASAHAATGGPPSSARFARVGAGRGKRRAEGEAIGAPPLQKPLGGSSAAVIPLTTPQAPATITAPTGLGMMKPPPGLEQGSPLVLKVPGVVDESEADIAADRMVAVSDGDGEDDHQEGSRLEMAEVDEESQISSDGPRPGLFPEPLHVPPPPPPPPIPSAAFLKSSGTNASSSSPFLDLRPPSPSAGAQPKLFFGKPSTNPPSLSVPGGLPFGTAVPLTSGSPRTGESLFGKPNLFAPSTGSTSFGGVGAQRSMFGIGTKGGSSAGITPFGSGGSGPIGSSPFLSFTQKVAMSTPASAPGEVLTTSLDPNADSEAPVSGGGAAAEGDAGETDVPILSLSATKALTAEERNMKRKAKFGLAAAGGTPTAGAPQPTGASPGLALSPNPAATQPSAPINHFQFLNKKRSLSQSAQEAAAAPVSFFGTLGDASSSATNNNNNDDSLLQEPGDFHAQQESQEEVSEMEAGALVDLEDQDFGGNQSEKDFGEE